METLYRKLDKHFDDAKKEAKSGQAGKRTTPGKGDLSDRISSVNATSADSRRGEEEMLDLLFELDRVLPHCPRAHA